MNSKKHLGTTILFSLVIIILISYAMISMRFRNNPSTLHDIIQNGNVSDLTLTIYYTRLLRDSRPYSIEWLTDLGNRGYRPKIIISGDRLEEHIDLLYRMSNVDLLYVENESRIHTRIYYVFETVSEGNIFDVAMWGLDETISVNGVQVIADEIFYEILLLFLPEYMVEELTKFLGHQW